MSTLVGSNGGYKQVGVGVNDFKIKMHKRKERREALLLLTNTSCHKMQEDERITFKGPPWTLTRWCGALGDVQP